MWRKKKETDIHYKRMQQASIKVVKTRPDWVGKVISYKLSKGLKFDHATKCSMYKPESILKMRYMKFSGTLKYKRIIKSLSEEQT